MKRPADGGKLRNAEEVFTDIYKRNAWGGKESVSGPGSSAQQTRIVVRELPSLINDFNISSMLDIPCGDFYWMRSVNLSGVEYVGADVVKELIQKNREQHERDGVRFQVLDLTRDNLPKADLIFCRDCLVHFSFKDVFSALGRICESQSEYLLTTTFLNRNDNLDIVTGQWCPRNFEVAPFMFPKPLRIINEQCMDGNGPFGDKSLALWSIRDIRHSLRHCP